MKHILLALSLIVLISCGTSKSGSQNGTTSANGENFNPIKTNPTEYNVKDAEDLKYMKDYAKEYAESITEDKLKRMLYTLASDDYEGRKTGEKGQKMAAEFIVDFYTKLGIPPADTTYLQHIPVDYFKGRSKNDSENVVAFIKGFEKPEEYVIISAHYDHIGVKGEEINNGADDDGSGTTAVMQIAQAFKKATDAGMAPKRSIVFLHVTGEEVGLFGSKYYTEHPIFPLDNTVANLNIDMIGRYDEKHAENPEFVYLIGSDKLSTELHELSEATNKKYTNLELDYTYNDENDPNRFYYRSDHYNFAKNNIPIIFYFNGVHEDYHKPTDTPDKINYDLLQKRAQLVFYTAWEIANRENRLTVDKK
ncbi:MAG: M28 family peptidase [Flavobacteriaceae bacterium]|nr:M28 family peptidase [Flavobacteriaceae bacterium]